MRERRATADRGYGAAPGAGQQRAHVPGHHDPGRRSARSRTSRASPRSKGGGSVRRAVRLAARASATSAAQRRQAGRARAASLQRPGAGVRAASRPCLRRTSTRIRSAPPRAESSSRTARGPAQGATATIAPPMDLTVAICTRDRPGLLRATLEALAAQTQQEFELVVVDQSGRPDPQLEALPRERPLDGRDPRRGHRPLARAQPRAARGRGDWIAFVDDDCVADPDMVAALLGELARPSGGGLGERRCVGGGRAGADYLPVTVFPVERPSGAPAVGRFRAGSASASSSAVRRATAERLGGWDERLGPGVPDLPAADDMDFNHRLRRDGGVAWLSPRVRLRHDQWRSPAELAPLQRGYVRAWAGFSMKHLKGGEPLAGLWLWSWGAIDVLHMSASAVRHRSRLRLRLALAKLRGLAEGTAMGARASLVAGSEPASQRGARQGQQRPRSREQQHREARARQLRAGGIGGGGAGGLDTRLGRGRGRRAGRFDGVGRREPRWRSRRRRRRGRSRLGPRRRGRSTARPRRSARAPRREREQRQGGQAVGDGSIGRRSVAMHRGALSAASAPRLAARGSRGAPTEAARGRRSCTTSS